MYCFNLLLYYWRFRIFSLLVLIFFLNVFSITFLATILVIIVIISVELGSLRACTRLASLCMLHKVFCLTLVCELDRGQVKIHLNTPLSLHLSLVRGYFLGLWLKPLACACSCLQGIEQERLLDWKWAAGGRRGGVSGALLWQKWLSLSTSLQCQVRPEEFRSPAAVGLLDVAQEQRRVPPTKQA